MDAFLDELLAAHPAIMLVGPRGCGKTTTALRHAKTLWRLDDPRQAALFASSPDRAIDEVHAFPLMLDEWQAVPDVLGAVKRHVDTRRGAGRFLLTGSVRAPFAGGAWPGTGRVIEINVRLGQQVKVGDALAVINSTELGQSQLDYIKARAQADLQARSVERARQLFAADVIGRAELQRRESELAIASAEQRAAADQLRVLGMSAAAISRLGNNGAINSVTPVVSTVAGTVVERRITHLLPR